MRKPRCTLLLLVLVALLITPADARKRRKPRPTDSSSKAESQFDYYVLALSWAPNYCATHRGNARECGSGRRVGFVVHGLWPQSEKGRLNEACQNTPPVSSQTVNQMLDIMPAAGLIQHEWSCHGIYSDLPPAEYFSSVRRAFEAIQVPSRIKNMSSETEVRGEDLLRDFADANHASPSMFGTSCHDGELVSVQACMSKDLKFRDCGPGVSLCKGQLLLRPPR